MDPSLITWTAEPGVILGLLGLAGAYALGLVRLRPQTPEGQEAISIRYLAYFGGGMLLMVLALASPIDPLSDSLFSMHMIQHLLLVYFAPPLLLLGLPAWLVEPFIRLPGVRPVLRAITGFIPATLIFNGLLTIWHFPSLWDFALYSKPIHGLEHVSFFIAGIICWWPIFSPTPEVPRLSYPSQMLYLFVQSIVPAVIGSFVTFSTQIIYPLYLIAPKLWGLTALTDQQLAGLLMKVMGTLYLWILLTVRFFQWFTHEEREQENRLDEIISAQPH